MLLLVISLLVGHACNIIILQCRQIHYIYYLLAYQLAAFHCIHLPPQHQNVCFYPYTRVFAIDQKYVIPHETANVRGCDSYLFLLNETWMFLNITAHYNVENEADESGETEQKQ